MALILLFNIGALLGWLGSIVLRLDEPGAVLRMMLVGIVASLTAGLLANGGTFLGSLSLLGFGAGVGVTLPAIVGYYAFATRQA
ncbi:hypothetical protein EH31_15405 [Erythrobacter longus]|uniref:Uncharacterized protein n=1 Tax=Erythrobacter longus TaxID=1044 RepID=A0A074M2V0_ERYLO|nr:hypothetical protein [Erythrobacter longus]KEO88821.1 hypothetical protein EH31_15405 [Erythrobacter longus]